MKETRIKGQIESFGQNTITIVPEDKPVPICIPIKNNGNFMHSYVGEIVELIVDETGLAINCINERHKP